MSWKNKVRERGRGEEAGGDEMEEERKEKYTYGERIRRVRENE